MYHPCTYYYSTGIRPRRGRSTAIASVVPLGQRWLFSGERHIVGDASLCSNMRSDELFNRLLGQDARIIWFIWTPRIRVPSSSSVFENAGRENQNSNDSVPVNCNQEIPIQSGTDFPPCSIFSVCENYGLQTGLQINDLITDEIIQLQCRVAARWYLVWLQLVRLLCWMCLDESSYVLNAFGRKQLEVNAIVNWTAD